jgi:hypothetical protein
MSKDVINVHGEDVVVREDTAKAYRGVNWMILSLLGFIIIVAIVAGIFFFSSLRNGRVESPTQTDSTNSR